MPEYNILDVASMDLLDGWSYEPSPNWTIVDNKIVTVQPYTITKAASQFDPYTPYPVLYAFDTVDISSIASEGDNIKFIARGRVRYSPLIDYAYVGYGNYYELLNEGDGWLYFDNTNSASSYAVEDPEEYYMPTLVVQLMHAGAATIEDMEVEVEFFIAIEGGSSAAFNATWQSSALDYGDACDYSPSLDSVEVVSATLNVYPGGTSFPLDGNCVMSEISISTEPVATYDITSYVSLYIIGSNSSTLQTSDISVSEVTQVSNFTITVEANVGVNGEIKATTLRARYQGTSSA